jgi:micrococcal nuclease
MYEYKVQVLRVIDGDTLEIKVDVGFDWGFTDDVRLYGINCPETKGATKPAGLAAKSFTKIGLTAAGTFVIKSEKYNRREKYGRILASLYRDADPLSLNDALLRSGNAVVMKD